MTTRNLAGEDESLGGQAPSHVPQQAGLSQGAGPEAKTTGRHYIPQGRGIPFTTAPLQVLSGDFPHMLVYGPSGAGKKTRIMCLLRELYGSGVEKLRIEHMNFTVSSSRKSECASTAILSVDAVQEKD